MCSIYGRKQCIASVVGLSTQARLVTMNAALDSQVDNADSQVAATSASLVRVPQPLVSPLHLLRYPWVFWHYRRSKRTTKTWMDCQRVLAELHSLEHFWHFFVRLQCPSVAKINQDYALFKKGIEPMWEDPSNVKGGQWIFLIQKSSDNYRQLVDHVWDEIVLALICSIFKPAIMDLVCGVVFSMRLSSFTKISVWISDYTAVKELLILGHELKRLANFEECIIFRRNEDMKVKFIL